MSLTELMPGWVGWLGPAAVVLVVIAWMLLVPGLTLLLIRRRLREDMHWTERAGFATEARAAIAAGIVIWPVATAGLVYLLIGPFSRVPTLAIFLVIDIMSPLVSLRMAWWFLREVLHQPLPGFGEYLWLTARKWWPLIALVLIGVLAPARLASWWMIPWTVVAVGALFGLRYLAELFVATGVAKRSDARVEAAVARAAARYGAEPPATYVVDSHAANALALPARNVMITTTRLVDVLDDAEIEAISLHEIAHLNERRSVTRRRTLSLLLMLPLLAIKPLLGVGMVALLIALTVTLVATRLLGRMSAAEETRADHEAFELSHEGEAFGHALLKIHQAALIPAYVRRDTHGPLHDRLVRAGLTPDWEPIVKGHKMRRLQLTVAMALVVMVAGVLVPASSIDQWDGESGSHAAIAFGWREEVVLGYTGYLAADAGDFERAVVYLEEATERGYLGSLADLTWALASLGRCTEAREAHFEMLASDLPFDDQALAGRWVAFCYQAG